MNESSNSISSITKLWQNNFSLFWFIFSRSITSYSILILILGFVMKYTFKMLGSVRYFRQFSWPPIFATRPLFSVTKSNMLVEVIPTPTVRESPIAAITSMSPGLRRWTDSGTSGDLPPKKIAVPCQFSNANILVNYEIRRKARKLYASVLKNKIFRNFSKILEVNWT
mgnify:CR=1 FL=1